MTDKIKNNVSTLFSLIFLGWWLVAKSSECQGSSESFKGYQGTVQDCALSCKDVSPYFIFATNESGNNNCYQNCCNNEGCRCFCENGTNDGLCNQINNKGYNLYSYSSNRRGKYFFEKIVT